ncbi:MAG: adenylate/guanylate cyclase domain-containing protein [bacterium]
MAFLIYTYQGTPDETIYNIDKDIISAGRLPSNDIVLLDSSVSRNHFVIKKEQDGFYIYDNGSSNGTLLNGNRISGKVKLSDQDQITAGKVVFTFRENELTTIKEVSADTLNNVALSPSALNNIYFDIIFSIARESIYSTDQNELYSKTIKLICDAAKAEYGAMLLIDERTGKLEVIASNYKQAPDNRMIGSTIINRAIKNRAAILVKSAFADTRFTNDTTIKRLGINSAICAPIWEKEYVYGAIYIDRRINPMPFDEEHLNFLTVIANLIALNIARDRLQNKIAEERNISDQIKRFVPIEAVESLLKTIRDNPSEMWNIQEVERATVMFADIVGFTSLTEKNKPEDIARLLRTFFERATDIVLSNGGSINKFLGDGFMAIFGTPISMPDDPDRAIKSAITLLKWVKTAELAIPISLRIGIDTGSTIGIMVGSTQRLEYTIIGDCVNIASRLQALAKANQILISSNTNQFIKSSFSIKLLDEVLVKGKETPLKVYEVVC